MFRSNGVYLNTKNLQYGNDRVKKVFIDWYGNPESQICRFITRTNRLGSFRDIGIFFSVNIFPKIFEISFF